MPEIVDKRVITLAEALELMKQRMEEGEASDLHKRTLGYLEVFAKCGAEESRRLVESLVELGIPEEYAVIIANILPRTRGELRTIFAGSGKSYTPEELDVILEKIKEHCGPESGE